MNYVDLTFYIVLNVFYKPIHSQNGIINFINAVCMLIINILFIVHFSRIILLHCNKNNKNELPKSNSTK